MHCYSTFDGCYTLQVTFIASCGMLLGVALTYIFTRSKPVYLVDFHCFRPPQRSVLCLCSPRNPLLHSINLHQIVRVFASKYRSALHSAIWQIAILLCHYPIKILKSISKMSLANTREIGHKFKYISIHFLAIEAELDCDVVCAAKHR